MTFAEIAPAGQVALVASFVIVCAFGLAAAYALARDRLRRPGPGRLERPFDHLYRTDLHEATPLTKRAPELRLTAAGSLARMRETKQGG